MVRDSLQIPDLLIKILLMSNHVSVRVQGVREEFTASLLCSRLHELMIAGSANNYKGFMSLKGLSLSYGRLLVYFWSLKITKLPIFLTKKKGI